MDNKEKRFITGSIEIEQRNDDKESRTISGYAAVFDKYSSVLGGSFFRFKEKVARSAFDGTDMSGVIATFNHNFDNVLARADSNTLSLTVDDIGLRYSFEAPNTTAGNDLLENIRNGNVKGSSFMFTVEEQKWTYKEGEDEIDEREITKVGELIELGPVTLPAYPDTSVAERSYKESKPSDVNSDWFKRKLEIIKK
jgi:HK97 family phage prohead protease